MADETIQYRGNIYISKDPPAYHRETERVMALVNSTQAGQTLFKHINTKKPYMVIQPYDPKVEDDPVNAYAKSKVYDDGAPAGYVIDKIHINTPMGSGFDIPTEVGTGKGTMVYVHYHPATWREVNKRTGHIAPGDGPGEVLFHEMTHGLREQSGLLQYQTPVDGEERMDSIEEFFAIMAANVYRSERGFHQLRADHWSSKKITGPLIYQSAYYEHYKQYIDKWFNEQRGFCLDMARVPAKFNPFREAAVALGLSAGSAVGMRL
jgi:hypothetical protein